MLVDTSNSGAMNGVVPMEIIDIKIQLTLDISNLKRPRKNFQNIKTLTCQKVGFRNTGSFLETTLRLFFTIKTFGSSNWLTVVVVVGHLLEDYSFVNPNKWFWAINQKVIEDSWVEQWFVLGYLFERFEKSLR